MRRRFGNGSSGAGRRLKKSPKPAAHHRLHRRKRTERTPAPLSHLGATGTNTRAAVSLQLEDVVGDGGGAVVELLLPAVSGGGPQPPAHPFFRALAVARSRSAAYR